MHEVGLMTQTLEMAETLARDQGAQTIHRLVLRVGVFSGVDADALRFAFEAASAGTLAAEALLQIEEVAARCWCAECLAGFEPAGPIYECPTCGTLSGDLRQGNELELATLEIS